MFAKSPHPLLRIVAGAQGLYFLATGIWPFVSLRTFLLVTGPKEEIWLLMTVSVLVTAVGLVLVVACARKQIGAEVILLGIACAAGLAGIDLYYVSVGRIPPIYLADAAIEAVIILAWIAGAWLDR